MEKLVSNMREMSLRGGRGGGDESNQEPMNVMSKANLLLTPIEGDIFGLGNGSTTDLAQSSTYVALPNPPRQYPSGVSLEDVDEEFDSFLPPGIVLCDEARASSSTSFLNTTMPVQQSRDSPPSRPKSPRSNINNVPRYLKTPPTRRKPFEIYENHIVDEELPMEKRKKKRGPTNRSRFYENHVSPLA